MKDRKNDSFKEELFEIFKQNLKEQLNIKTWVSDEEINQSLIYIIKQYETLFNNNFTDLFLYDYYRDLLNTGLINKIINFVKQTINQKAKDEILKEERTICYNTLTLYGLKKEGNTYISQITNKPVNLNQKAVEIINNDDIFFIKPKGKEELMGPHAVYTLEYSENYWNKFKENVKNYIQTIKNQEYIEDLEDYRFWLTQYHTFNNFLNKNKGGKHVKN